MKVEARSWMGVEVEKEAGGEEEEEEGGEGEAGRLGGMAFGLGSCHSR